MSRQVLSDVGIQLKNLVATIYFFVSTDLLHSSHVLSRHAVFCRDIAPLYIQSFVLRQKKYCRDRVP